MSRQAGAPGVKRSWWFEPVTQSRIALFSALVYIWVLVDVALTSGWVRSHVAFGGKLYQPLQVSRVLHLPTPTHLLATLIEVAMVAGAVGAVVASVRRRWARTLGVAVFVTYGLWMLLAMSYGKVDHDRYAFLVALAVLPTVERSGRMGIRDDDRSSPEGGFALRCVQLAVVATYFFASWAKIRFGGWNWATGAVLERALLRRNTIFSHWLIDKPMILVPMQFAMVGVELLSPLALLARTDRSRTIVACAMYLFHLGIFVGVTISFLPHCVAIAAFLPLEKLARSTADSGVVGRLRVRLRPAAPAPT